MLYDIMVINTRTQFHCNNYNIILIPWYNYNLTYADTYEDMC